MINDNDKMASLLEKRIDCQILVGTEWIPSSISNIRKGMLFKPDGFTEVHIATSNARLTPHGWRVNACVQEGVSDE